MYDDIIPGPQFLAVDFSEELAGLHLKTGVKEAAEVTAFVMGDIVGSLNVMLGTEYQVGALIGEMLTLDSEDDERSIEDAVAVLEYAGVAIINKLKSFGVHDVDGNFNYTLTDRFNLEQGYLLEKSAPREWTL